MTTAPLRLLARDAEDLKVLAACVQDALVPLGDMLHVAAERRFVLALNRFRWEAGRPSTDAPFERIHSLLSIQHVAAVRIRGIDQRRRDTILALLSLTLGDGQIDLVFAGGGAIRLEIDRLDVALRDVGEAWPTLWRPGHDASDEPAS